MTRVLLGEKDFRTLIAGGVVKQRGGVEIALKDIGLHTMAVALSDQLRHFKGIKDNQVEKV